MQKNPNLFIQHIIDAVTRIQEYLKEQNISNQEGLENNEMVQDAIIRKLEVIGEACTKLETDFKKSHQKIPWQKITAMRNKLAHEYWDIDLEIVYTAATKEAPELKKYLIELVSKLGK